MTESEFSEAVGAGIRMVPGRKARAAATVFNIGNIVAIIVPIPLGMLWLGMSMLVYTQQAAYRFYGITGFFVAAATFIPGGGWDYYLLAWGLAALVLVPWSIIDLVRIRQDQWEDIELVEQNHESSSHP